jgi:regulator of sigma E protease
MDFISILYIIFAILGLSFLIFIHELGHYFMARRLGMKVETFSIGFGRPLFSWQRDNVRWQIGWLPFGGYVKIAGMDTAEKKDLYDVPGGFFSKRPLDRIAVAAMGPLVNIVFALLAFFALWFFGGREKNFADYTHKIGWLDPKSELYALGIRPGDEIVAYNGNEIQSAKDHISAPMTSPDEILIDGYRVNFETKEKTPFHYAVKTYPHPNAIDKDVVTAGVLNSASYVIYNQYTQGKENTLPEGSPMEESGIQYGDRIVWVDGVPIHSSQELSHVLNDDKALLTIRRGQETLLRRVPRVQVEELRLDSKFREELIDWQFEAELNGVKFQKLFAIPYNLDNESTVENQVRFIDQENEREAFAANPLSDLELPLQKDDRILAVDGIPVTYSYEILLHLQKRHVNIIVERDPKLANVSIYRDSDKLFDEQFSPDDLQKMSRRIGFVSAPQSEGNLHLLALVVPKMRKDFVLSPENQAKMQEEWKEQMREIESIEDPEKRAFARHQLEKMNKQLLLGLPSIQDMRVKYNPSPLRLFTNVFEEVSHTLKALVTGSLNPKWMSGPIGIVQVVHDHSMVSLKESLFWLGAISLNLGMLNLLPLPVLDGGTICFALYELVTGRRLKTKTLEKLIIPFALLLIGFFIFLTYHDLTRLLSHWVH